MKKKNKQTCINNLPLPIKYVVQWLSWVLHIHNMSFDISKQKSRAEFVAGENEEQETPKCATEMNDWVAKRALINIMAVHGFSFSLARSSITDVVLRYLVYRYLRARAHTPIQFTFVYKTINLSKFLCQKLTQPTNSIRLSVSIWLWLLFVCFVF